MKNGLKILLICLLFLNTFEYYINIKGVEKNYCDFNKGETIIKFDVNGNLTNQAGFSFFLKDDINNYEYFSNCTLEENNTKGVCVIDKVKDDLKFNQTSIINQSEPYKNITFSAQEATIKKCNFTKREDYEALLDITFMQISNFNVLDKNITFDLYGFYSKQYETLGEINVYVDLTKKGKKETSKASCIQENEPKSILIMFSCSINDDEPENVSSLVYVFSENITGIPKEKYLLDPTITDKLIENGTIKQVNISGPLPNIFTIGNINHTECNKTGIFTLTGNMTKEINETLMFELQISQIKSLSANCLINETNKTINVNIFCEINENFKEQQPLKIMQNLIYKGNETVLFINKSINNKDYFTCIIPRNKLTFHSIFCTDNNEVNEIGFSLSKNNIVENENFVLIFNGTDGEQYFAECSIKNINSNDDKEYNGTCIFVKKLNNSVEINNITLTEKDNNYDIKQESVNLTKCSKTDIPSSSSSGETDLKIIFRQLNNYNQTEEKISFVFYGIVLSNYSTAFRRLDEYNRYKHLYLDFNLIKDGFTEDKSKTAYCDLKEHTEDFQQVNNLKYLCTLYDINGSDYDSVRFNSSNDIIGVPEDDILINPFLTDQKINEGIINNINNDKLPLFFQITNMDNNECPRLGKFIIEGKLKQPNEEPSSNSISEDFRFKLLINKEKKTTANCLLNDTQKIYCETNGIIEKGKNTFTPKVIFDEDRNEKIIIGNSGNLGETDCNNAKLLSILEKNENIYPIVFRQVSHFKCERGKISFFFAGLTNKKLPDKYKINWLVNSITDGKQQEIECILSSQILSSKNEFEQSDFDCLGGVCNDNITKEGIEVYSSPNVIGMDNLKNYEKNPKLVDDLIQKTKNNKGIGKMSDYLQEKRKTVPTLYISDIYFNNCPDEGKLKMVGSFNKDNKQKVDFEIHLSYPDSSIFCTAPKIKANIKTYIDCKVKEEFIDIEDVFLEPSVIKKKYSEILYVNGYKKNNNMKIACLNYYKLENEMKKKKFEANNTFLQTNDFSFNLRSMLFKLFIFRNPGYNKILIITAVIREKYKETNLRSLDNGNNIGEEKVVITCEPPEPTTPTTDSPIISYKCSSGSNVKIEEKDIDNIYLISDEIAGLSEDNSDPKKTTDLIKNGTIKNVSLDSNFYILENPKIEDSTCKNDGNFNITGIKNVPTQNVKGDIIFANPNFSGAICEYNKVENKLICHNKEEFEEQTLLIEPQLMNGTFMLLRGNSVPNISCSISDLSFIKAEEVESVNPMFPKKKGGISGGMIALIVIILTLVTVGVGILVALFKSGKFDAPKVPANNTNDVKPEMNSTTNII